MAVINEILSFLLCHQIYFNFSAMEDQYNFISALSSTRNKFLFTVVLNISGSLTETSRQKYPSPLLFPLLHHHHLLYLLLTFQDDIVLLSSFSPNS